MSFGEKRERQENGGEEEGTDKVSCAYGWNCCDLCLNTCSYKYSSACSEVKWLLVHATVPSFSCRTLCSKTALKKKKCCLVILLGANIINIWVHCLKPVQNCSWSFKCSSKYLSTQCNMQHIACNLGTLRAVCPVRLVKPKASWRNGVRMIFLLHTSSFIEFSIDINANAVSVVSSTQGKTCH